MRLFNTSKWTKLPAGDVLELPGDDIRNVVVQVNTEAPTRVDVFFGAQEQVFLGVVMGLETIEFTAERDCYLSFSSDGEVWYFTNSSEANRSSEVGDGLQAVSFTKIATRRTRNPELELMMFKQQQNAARNEAKQRAELDALRAQFEEMRAQADARISAPATGGTAPSPDGMPAGEAETEPEGTSSDAGTSESVPDGQPKPK